MLEFNTYCRQTTSKPDGHPAKTSKFSLLEHVRSKFSRVLALTIKIFLIHNNTQMLEKRYVGCLKVTCHFTNAMEIVNCLHKKLFIIIISEPGNDLLHFVEWFGYYIMLQCIWTYYQVITTRVKFP